MPPSSNKVHTALSRDISGHHLLSLFSSPLSSLSLVFSTSRVVFVTPCPSDSKSTAGAAAFVPMLVGGIDRSRGEPQDNPEGM